MKDALATFVKVSTNSAIPLLGIGVPTKDEITCTGVFTAVLLVRAKHPGEKKSPPTGDWLDQLWTIHPMERCEGIKTNEKAPGALIQKDHQRTL